MTLKRSSKTSGWAFWCPSQAHRGVCVQAKAASPCLTSLCLPAFPGLNPDQACLDLSLPAHNRGVGGRTGGGPEAARDGWWEGRKGCGESDPDSDPHIHSTVYFLGKQTDCAGSQYTGWEKDGGGRYEAGERETRCKQEIRQRKGILNNMCLESLKI